MSKAERDRLARLADTARRSVELTAHSFRVLLATGEARAFAATVEVTCIDGVLMIRSEHGALVASFAPGQWRQVERLDL